jgi:hypothetical protein
MFKDEDILEGMAAEIGRFSEGQTRTVLSDKWSTDDRPRHATPYAPFHRPALSTESEVK